MNKQQLLSTVTISIALVLYSALAIGFEQDISLPVYQKAVREILKGDYSAAIAKLEVFIRDYPDSSRIADATYHLAYCNEKLGNFTEAFDIYVSVEEQYSDKIVSRRAKLRAIELAKKLNRTKDDDYAKYLERISQTANKSNHHYITVYVATNGTIVKAEDLIDTLQNGNEYEQIKASELLRHQVNKPEVKKAFIGVLKNATNSVVRVNALAGLAPYNSDPDIKNVILNSMLTDADYHVRILAIRSMQRKTHDPEVFSAFEKVLKTEKNNVVIRSALEELRNSRQLKNVEGIIVDRLKIEQDPMINFLLAGFLDTREFSQEKIVTVMKSLVDNPEPHVRMGAIKLLSANSDDIEVKNILLDRLKNDPSNDVKFVALDALKEFSDDKDVQRVVIDTIKTTDDVALVSTSLKSIRPHLEEQEIRIELADSVDVVSNPIAAGQITYVLSSHLDDPEVKTRIFNILKEPGKENIKIAILGSLGELRWVPADFTEEMIELYEEEQDQGVARRYFYIVNRLDPDKARTLKDKEGKKITVEVEVTSKKK